MPRRYPTPTSRPRHPAIGLPPLPAALAFLAALAVTPAPAAEPYSLTPSELKLDCKQLTGTIKVRLMALKQKPIAPSTMVSRGIQTLATPIFGGTSYGTDEKAQRAADMHLVEAYNKRLVEKNCPSFDLAAALAAGDTASPSPTVPARKGDAKK